MLDNELVRLLLVLAFAAAMTVYVMRHQARYNGDPIVSLKAENEDLRAEVERLRITVDTVLHENGVLRREVETLRKQVRDLGWLIDLNRPDARQTGNG